MYAKALSVPIVTNNVDEVVPVVLARAAWEKRLATGGDNEEETDLNQAASVILDGIGRVRQSQSLCSFRTRLSY